MNHTRFPKEDHLSDWARRDDKVTKGDRVEDFTELCRLVLQTKRGRGTDTISPLHVYFLLQVRQRVIWNCDMGGSHTNDSLCRIRIVVTWFSESYVYWTVHHLDSWIKIDQLDVTCFIISLFNAQHVSNVNTYIIRSLRLICWVISWFVLLWFDVCWC